MSNLITKFTDLETLLGSDHTELINALNAILEALGAPPPTATTTLATVVTALNAMISAQATQHSALMSLLGDINTNIDTILTNNSLNAQRLLGALVLLDPCRDCATMTTLPPIIDVTPQEVDVEHCQRMQALLYALLQMAVKMDVVSTFGTGFSLTVIQDSLDQVFSDLGSPAGLLLPSFVETSRLVASLVVYVASNIFSPESIPFSLQTLHDALLVALYDTDNANDGLVAYAAVVNASGLSSQMKSVLIALGYNSLFNFYYDTNSAAPYAGFDGSLCAPPETGSCQIYDFVGTPDHFFIARFNPEFSDPVNSWNVGNYNGWRFTLTSSSHPAEFVLVDDLGTLTIMSAVGDSWIVGRDTMHISFATRYNNTILGGTYEVCPPGTFIP